MGETRRIQPDTEGTRESKPELREGISTSAQLPNTTQVNMRWQSQGNLAHTEEAHNQQVENEQTKSIDNSLIPFRHKQGVQVC